MTQLYNVDPSQSFVNSYLLQVITYSCHLIRAVPWPLRKEGRRDTPALNIQIWPHISDMSKYPQYLYSCLDDKTALINV